MNQISPQMTLIIWRGNPSSGGTGYIESGTDLTQMMAKAYARAHNCPTSIFHYFALARQCPAPLARIGDSQWSVEIRREKAPA